jgi:hypothetical protein
LHGLERRMQVDPQDLIKRCDIDLAQPLGADETDIAGLFKICLTLALVLAAADPIVAFMADVFNNRKTFLTPLVGPVGRYLFDWQLEPRC